MPLTHDEAFLEDICGHPDDDATRLIYADWLDDRDDAARTEFVRVQVALHTTAPDDDRHDDLVRREEALLQEHEGRWRAELPPLEGVHWEDFSGGFVEAVFVLSAEVFFRQSAAIFAAAPVRRVRIGRIGPGDALLLSRCAALGRLTELNLGNTFPLGREGVHALSLSPYLAELKALLLHYNDLGSGAVEDLARSPYLGRLEELYLAGNELDDDGVRSLVERAAWHHLKDLDLRDNRIGDDGALAVGASSSLPTLSTLYLVNNRIGPVGASALAWAEGLPRLARLFLNYNPVGDEGAIAFALTHRRQALRDLDLRQAGIRDPGGEALATSDALDGLDLLWLRDNHFRRGTVTGLRQRYGRRLRI